jgi:hypothetical protein
MPADMELAFTVLITPSRGNTVQVLILAAPLYKYFLMGKSPAASRCNLSVSEPPSSSWSELDVWMCIAMLWALFIDVCSCMIC